MHRNSSFISSQVLRVLGDLWPETVEALLYLVLVFLHLLQLLLMLQPLIIEELASLLPLRRLIIGNLLLLWRFLSA